MKWFRIILPIFLLVVMLLGVSSVAYADPGVDVDIVVVGDNPDVGVDIYGDNPEVWINGQNLNEPTAVYNVQGVGTIGVDGGWVKQRISEAVAPLQFLAEGQVAGLNLTMDGLAKVILLAQSNESILGALGSLSDEHGNRLTDLESETAYLGEQVDALDAQITAEVNQLADSYNRTLAIISGAFLLVVIGLATGLVLLWRRH